MINDKIKTVGLLALFALLPACADDAPFDKGHEPESGTHEYYLRLTLRHPEAGLPTRSTPTGGEPGDGHEPGQDHETRIDDLTLLFYRGTDGVNSDASTPIDKIIYLDRDAMEGDNRTEPVPVNLPAGEYDLLTVANSGDLRPQLQGKTLGGVRDYLLQQAWTEDEEGRCSRFVMTSDGHTPDRVSICNLNTADNPASATVEVERLAARIDYRTRHETYTVDDATYGRAAASITGAVVLNKMKAGSFLLKRTAAPDNGRLTAASALTYLGDERPAEGGVQRNYVADPWSLQKKAAPVNAALAKLYDNYYTSFGPSQAAWEAAIRTGTAADGWQRLDYTQENTMSREAQSDAYRTMVVFQARYTPEGYEPGQTFYRVKGRIFPTRAEAEAAAQGTGALVREYHDGLCYYVWRVRHSNDGNDATQGIMEYAIVRNNIYRLLVASIDGLGDEVPFPEPDGKDPDPVDPDDPDPDEPDPDEPDPDNPDPDNPDPDEPDPDNPDPDNPDPEEPPITIVVTVEEWTQLNEHDIYL